MRRLPSPQRIADPDVREYLRQLVDVLNLEIRETRDQATDSIKPQEYSVEFVTSDYEAGNRTCLFCDTGGGAVTVTLPDPEDYYRRLFVVKKAAGANTLSVDVVSSGTIDGGASSTVTTSKTFISNGQEWKEI